MNVARQVGHVLVKDLRQARWTLLAYGVLVLGVTAIAVTRSPLVAGETTPVLVVLLGMLLVVSAVQWDSPTSTEAYWASQPLAPLAVLGAKLVLATVIVIGLPAIGQALSLAALGAQASHLPALLAPSLWLYGGCLLFAMIVAALTRDLRTFLLVLIVAPVGASISTLLIAQVYPVAAASDSPNPSHLGIDATRIVSLVVGASGLALLAALYRLRRSRRYAWLLGTVYVASLILLLYAGAPTGSGSDGPSTVVEISDGVRPVFSLGLDPDVSTTEGSLGLILSLDSAERGTRLALANAAAVIRLQDGSTIRIPLAPHVGTNATIFALDDSTMAPPEGDSTSVGGSPLDPGTKWLARPTRHAKRHRFWVPLDGAQRAALASGVEWIGLEGSIVVETPSLVGTAPLEPGAMVTRRDLEVQILSWTQRPYEVPKLETEVVWAPVDGLSRSPERQAADDTLQFALWNPARREATALDQGSGAISHTSGWLVLPGLMIERRRGNRVPAERFWRHPRDEGWFRGARLAIIEWTPRGSYPLDLRTADPWPTASARRRSRYLSQLRGHGSRGPGSAG